MIIEKRYTEAQFAEREQLLQMIASIKRQALRAMEPYLQRLAQIEGEVQITYWHGALQDEYFDRAPVEERDPSSTPQQEQRGEPK